MDWHEFRNVCVFPVHMYDCYPGPVPGYFKHRECPTPPMPAIAYVVDPGETHGDGGKITWWAVSCE